MEYYRKLIWLNKKINLIISSCTSCIRFSAQRISCDKTLFANRCFDNVEEFCAVPFERKKCSVEKKQQQQQTKPLSVCEYGAHMC
jgi:hypothetical protein